MTDLEEIAAVDALRKDQEIERLRAENSVLRAENSVLRAENSVLRPTVSDLVHKLRVIEGKCRSCEYHPGNQDNRA